MVVPDSMCPQPPPAQRQYCNILDCPVRWEVSAWSKCSKLVEYQFSYLHSLQFALFVVFFHRSCGAGIKERRVECKQIMAKDHTVERRDELCPSIKPVNQKPCNTKPCAPEDQRPSIAASNTTYIQHDPKKTKVTLKIGGAATVFLGTQIKIKCPVKRYFEIQIFTFIYHKIDDGTRTYFCFRYNRTKIRWTKNSKFLGKTKNIKLSKKGALRILDVAYRDVGVYACHAGLSVAKLKLKVKPKPGDRDPTPADYESIEDDEEIISNSSNNSNNTEIEGKVIRAIE